MSVGSGDLKKKKQEKSSVAMVTMDHLLSLRTSQDSCHVVLMVASMPTLLFTSCTYLAAG